MSTQNVALYRKYRSLKLEDVVGQEHITKPLAKAVSEGRISHGYLFTGPHGVGKTSIARILAHQINELPYKNEMNHIDIIEIDAASNRRIDEIRDLREKAHIMPSLAKYKVYIIDEVHMLTKEAFNALLKTLEEPPEHVIFMLATTELHKLPPTIVSRTQRHGLRPIDEVEMKTHLQTIAQKESISINDGALSTIAEYAKGSLRDAISLLDQVASIGDDTITTAAVEDMLGLSSQAAVDSLLSAVLDGNSTQAIQLLDEFIIAGAQPEVLASQLTHTLRKHADYTSHLDLAHALLGVGKSVSPGVQLELVLLQALTHTSSTPQTVVKDKSHKAPPSQGTPKQKQSPKKKVVLPEAAPVKPKQEIDPNTTVEPEHWQQVIDEVKQHNNAIASILRTSNVAYDNGYKVTVRFAFHKRKLEDAETLNLIHQAMAKVIGKAIPIDIQVDSKATSSTQPNSTDEKPVINEEADDMAEKIISTFGGGERVPM